MADNGHHNGRGRESRATAVPVADTASAAGIGPKATPADECESDLPVYNRVEMYADPKDSTKWEIASETDIMNNTLNKTLKIKEVDYKVKYQLNNSNEWHTWIENKINIDYNAVGIYSKDIPPGPPEPLDEGTKGPRQYITLDEKPEISNIKKIESNSIVKYEKLPLTSSSSCSSSANYTDKIPPPKSPPEGEVGDWTYWKNHQDSWIQKRPSNEFYSSGKTWNEMLNTPLTSNSYYILGVQYMAAVLNKDGGANVPQAIKDTMNGAEAWFKGRNPDSCAAQGSCPQQKLWAEMLAEYNEAINYKNGLPDYPPPRPGSEGFTVTG